jgi:hypothetical protein
MKGNVNMAEKRPASEWYNEDHTCDIFDPDGWSRGSETIKQTWYEKPISYKRYIEKRDSCTTGPYMKHKHVHPF